MIPSTPYYPSKPPRVIPTTLAALLTLACASLASAQTSSENPKPAPAQAPAPRTAQNAAKTDANDDDVVQLSEFTVSAQAQTGYIASESMTGSRMPTKIRDLPFNIDVVTSEFLDDFAIVDESQIVEGGMITFDQDAGGGQIIRGIKASGQLYNGFWMPAGTPVPTVLKDRTEILKGPSAGIYGQTSPGGIVNNISKQPKFTNSSRFGIMYGNYSQKRVRAESTGPIAPRTAYLAILSYDDRDFLQPWRHNTNYTGAFSILHKFNPTTQLSIDFTAVNQRNKAPANRIPYYYNSVLSRYYDYAWDLVPTSGTGPKSWADSDTYSIFALFEKRINPVFSYRLGTDYVARRDQSFNTTALTVFDPDPSHATNDPYGSSGFYGLSRVRSSSSSYSAPGYRKDNYDSGGLQGDILARYRLFNKKVEARSMLTFDFSTRYQYTEKWSMPQRVDKANSDGSPSTKNAVDPSVFPWDPTTIGSVVTNDYFWQNYWLPIVNPLDPASSPYVDFSQYPDYDIYHVPDFDKTKFILRSGQKSRRDVLGVMFRQTFLLFNRLNLYGSIRFDNVTYNYTTTDYPSWSPVSYPQYAAFWGYTPSTKVWHSSNWTPSTGFNYQLTRGFNLYGNYSTSFSPSGQTVSGTSKETLILPNEIAYGYDYGLKFSFLSDMLTGTIGGFYINQQNMSVTEEDPNGAGSFKQAVGNVVSRGAEASVNYNITRTWSIKGGYYYTNAKWVYAGVDKDLVGRSRANVPPVIITLTTKYSFQNDTLKGLSIFATYQHSRACPSDEGGSITVNGIVPPGSNNGLRDLTVPSLNRFDVGASYGFKYRMFRLNAKHSVQLNVRNVFDTEYITQSRGIGDSRSIIGTYTVSF